MQSLVGSTETSGGGGGEQWYSMCQVRSKGQDLIWNAPQKGPSDQKLFSTGVV